jgi:hypothetical protein
MSSEIWKPVPGYEGCYEVSNLGNVRSLDRIIPWKNSTRRIKGKMCSQPTEGHNGYKTVRVCRNWITKGWLTHRLVAEVFVPNPENKPVVNHKDGNKENNAAINLEWVTHSENAQHVYTLGRRKSTAGTANGNARLTDIQLQQIKKRYATGNVTQDQLAYEYGVCKDTIWRHVKGTKRKH